MSLWFWDLIQGRRSLVIVFNQLLLLVLHSPLARLSITWPLSFCYRPGGDCVMRRRSWRARSGYEQYAHPLPFNPSLVSFFFHFQAPASLQWRSSNSWTAFRAQHAMGNTGFLRYNRLATYEGQRNRSRRSSWLHPPKSYSTCPVSCMCHTPGQLKGKLVFLRVVGESPWPKVVLSSKAALCQ